MYKILASVGERIYCKVLERVISSFQGSFVNNGKNLAIIFVAKSVYKDLSTLL